MKLSLLVTALTVALVVVKAQNEPGKKSSFDLLVLLFCLNI
jgi:hypothetical protein